jgi:hypothetical protein
MGRSANPKAAPASYLQMKLSRENHLSGYDHGEESNFTPKRYCSTCYDGEHTVVPEARRNEREAKEARRQWPRTMSANSVVTV